MLVLSEPNTSTRCTVFRVEVVTKSERTQHVGMLSRSSRGWNIIHTPFTKRFPILDFSQNAENDSRTTRCCPGCALFRPRAIVQLLRLLFFITITCSKRGERLNLLPPISKPYPYVAAAGRTFNNNSSKEGNGATSRSLSSQPQNFKLQEGKKCQAVKLSYYFTLHM